MANDLPFIDPTAGGGKARIVPAPASDGPCGQNRRATDNTKEQGDVILETVAQALKERYGVAKVIIRRKEHYSKPATAEIINEMAKEVQVAVAAVGG
jgi:hypothetical protein